MFGLIQPPRTLRALNEQPHLKTAAAIPPPNNIDITLDENCEVPRRNALIAKKVSLIPKDHNPYDDIEPIEFEISELIELLFEDLPPWIVGESAEHILTGLDHTRIEICYYLKKTTPLSEVKSALHAFLNKKIQKECSEDLIYQKYLYDFKETENYFLISLGDLDICFTYHHLDGFHISSPKDTNSMHCIVNSKYTDCLPPLQNLKRKHHVIPDPSLLREIFWQVAKYRTRGFTLEFGSNLNLKTMSEIALKQLEILFPTEGFLTGAFQEMIVKYIEKQAQTPIGKAIYVVNLISFLILNENEKSWAYIREIAMAWLSNFVTKTDPKEIPILEPLALLLKDNPSQAKDLLSIVKGLFLYKWLKPTNLSDNISHIPFIDANKHEYFLAFEQSSVVNNVIEFLQAWKKIEKLPQNKLFQKLSMGLQKGFKELIPAYRYQIAYEISKYFTSSPKYENFLKIEYMTSPTAIQDVSRTVLSQPPQNNSPPLAPVSAASQKVIVPPATTLTNSSTSPPVRAASPKATVQTAVAASALSKTSEVAPPILTGNTVQASKEQPPLKVTIVYLEQAPRLGHQLLSLSASHPFLEDLIQALVVSLVEATCDLEKISKALLSLLVKQKYLTSPIPLITEQLNFQIFKALSATEELPPQIRQLLLLTIAFYLLSEIPSDQKDALFQSYSDKLKTWPELNKLIPSDTKKPTLQLLSEFISNAGILDIANASRILRLTKTHFSKDEYSNLQAHIQNLRFEKPIQEFALTAFIYLKQPPQISNVLASLKKLHQNYSPFIEELHTYLKIQKPSLNSVQSLINSISTLPLDDELHSEFVSEIILKIIEKALHKAKKDTLFLKVILEFTQTALDHNLLSHSHFEKCVEKICKALQKIGFAEFPNLLVATHEFLMKTKTAVRNGENLISQLQARLIQAAGRASEFLEKNVDNNAELLTNCLFLSFKTKNNLSKIETALVSYWKYAITSKNGYWLRIGYELALLSFKHNIAKEHHSLLVELSNLLLQITPTELEEGLKSTYYRDLGIHLFTQILSSSKDQNICSQIEKALLNATFECLMSKMKNEKKAEAFSAYMKILSVIHPQNNELFSILKMDIDFKKSLSMLVKAFVSIVFKLDKNLGSQFAKNPLLKSRTSDTDFEEIQHLDFYSDPANITVESLSQKIEVWNRSFKLSEIQISDAKWPSRVKDTLELLKILTEHQPTKLSTKITGLLKTLISTIKKAKDQNDKWKLQTSKTIGKSLAHTALALKKHGKIPSSNQLVNNARLSGLLNQEIEEEIFDLTLSQFLERSLSEDVMKEFIAFMNEALNKKGNELKIALTGCRLIQKFAPTDNFKLLTVCFSCLYTLLNLKEEIWFPWIDKTLSCLIEFKAKSDIEEISHNECIEKALEKISHAFLPSFSESTHLVADFSSNPPLLSQNHFDNLFATLVISGKIWKFPKISEAIKSLCLIGDLQKQLSHFVLQFASNSSDISIHQWIKNWFKLGHLENHLNLASHVACLNKKFPSSETAKDLAGTMASIWHSISHNGIRTGQEDIKSLFTLYIDVCFKSKDHEKILVVLFEGSKIPILHPICRHAINQYFSSHDAKHLPGSISQKEMIKKMMVSEDEHVSQTACNVLIFYFLTEKPDKNSENELNAMFTSVCRLLILSKASQRFPYLFMAVSKFFGESLYSRKLFECVSIVEAYLDSVLSFIQSNDPSTEIKMVTAISKIFGNFSPLVPKAILHLSNLLLNSSIVNDFSLYLLKSAAYEAKVFPKGKRHEGNNYNLPAEIFNDRSIFEKNVIISSLGSSIKVGSSLLEDFRQMVDFNCQCSNEKENFLIAFEKTFNAFILFGCSQEGSDIYEHSFSWLTTTMQLLLNDALGANFVKSALKSIEKYLFKMSLFLPLIQYGYAFIQKKMDKNRDQDHPESKIISEMSKLFLNDKEMLSLIQPYVNAIFNPIKVTSKELLEQLVEIPHSNFQHIMKLNPILFVPKFYQLLIITITSKAFQEELKLIEALNGSIKVDAKLKENCPFLVAFYELQKVFVKFDPNKIFLDPLNKGLMLSSPKFYEAYLRLV